MDGPFHERCYPANVLASRLLAGLLFLLLTSGVISAQSTHLRSIRSAVNNGMFDEAVNRGPVEIERARRSAAFAEASEIGVLLAQSLIRLERYDEAGKVLDMALADAERSKNTRISSRIYFTKAALSRTRRNFSEAVQYARKGFSVAPNDPQIRMEYHLAIGRIMYSSGYDIAAIVWLEKAEKLSATLPVTWSALDVLGHLSFAWASKFNYAKAVEYGEKLVKTAERTEYKYRYRLALFELGNLRSSVGQERKATALLKKGLDLSMSTKDDYESCLFLNTLLLSSLYEGDVQSAERHLSMLESFDHDKRFRFGSVLGRAVIAARKREDRLAEQYFSELSSLKGYSDYIVPYWRSTIAEQMKDWNGMVEQGEALRKLAEAENFRDDLPGIYFSIAKGYHGLGKIEAALDHARRAAAIVENGGPIRDASLSLSMLETYHSVYRLLAEAEVRNDIVLAMGLADYLKGHVLKDLIENSMLRDRVDIGIESRKRAEDFSAKYVEGNSEAEKELSALEKSATLANDVNKLDFENRPIGSFNIPDRTSIVSYFFTLSGQLLAFVVEKDRTVRMVRLSLSEKEAERLAASIRTKMHDRVFFKSDGKDIYDRLLAPLSLNADHIIIVPDKALWKIPFQALSPDGDSYLIEQKTISYAPSISILIDQQRKPAPVRKTIKVFANNLYNGRFLRYADAEARTIGKLFGSQPVLNANIDEFLRSAEQEDILHFAMHAELDPEEPLASFLGFRPISGGNGRVTVEDLLKVHLKPRGLVFLASCDTSNVLNGEGVVSLAWAMLASGSTSVISTQWEANDKATELFTQEFYIKYRDGMSAAKALQSAYVTMIRNKTGELHEPYYWAAFSLLGDFR